LLAFDEVDKERFENWHRISEELASDDELERFVLIVSDLFQLEEDTLSLVSEINGAIEA